MPAERAEMRKIREVLRLKHAHQTSERQISFAVGLSRSTIGDYLKRAARARLSWPIPEAIDDAALERLLFPPRRDAPVRVLPDWRAMHNELKRRGVTLMLLWEEYRAVHGEGYAYSHFCQLYRDWQQTISPVMRQTHGPAEKLFVDFAGDTVAVFDAATGEERRAHIFVAALGASNYTYAEARWTQSLPDWIGAHANAFAALGGVPHAVVCDNLKAGVTATCRYEPGVNRTYQDLATHYDTAILPARPRKPRDIDGHYYSAPSRLIRAQVEVRITDKTVEILHGGGRVASHVRSFLRNRHTTIAGHMPSAHRRYAEWTPARMMREAAKIGPATIALIETVMKAKPHPEQGFRACLGILRLARTYGSQRLEAACERGNAIGARNYGSIASILKHGLDKAYAAEKAPEAAPIWHGNIRGGGYYH